MILCASHFLFCFRHLSFLQKKWNFGAEQTVGAADEQQQQLQQKEQTKSTQKVQRAGQNKATQYNAYAH